MPALPSNFRPRSRQAQNRYIGDTRPWDVLAQNGELPDLTALASMPYQDIAPFADMLSAGNKESSQRIQAALRAAQKNPANIVDKLAPALQAVGFLADVTSGDRRRRARSLPLLQQFSRLNRQRLGDKRQQQQERLRQQFLSEELMGKNRLSSYQAQAQARLARNEERANQIRSIHEAYGQQQANMRTAVSEASAMARQKQAQGEAERVRQLDPRLLQFWDDKTNWNRIFSKLDSDEPLNKADYLWLASRGIDAKDPDTLTAEKRNEVRAQLLKGSEEQLAMLMQDGEIDEIMQFISRIDAVTDYMTGGKLPSSLGNATTSQEDPGWLQKVLSTISPTRDEASFDQSDPNKGPLRLSPKAKQYINFPVEMGLLNIGKTGQWLRNRLGGGK